MPASLALRRLLAAFLALSLPVLAIAAARAADDPAPQPVAERSAAKLDERLDRLAGYGFAGVVLVARGQDVELARGYGLANRETGLEWSPDVVSDIGSITKQFTAAAILLLEEQGKLSVDDAITKHFPEVPPDKQAITLHQLLTHSSGIVDLPGRGDWDPVGRDEIVRLLMEAPLASEPGERYAYSNAGYSLLGVIIEQLTGVSYEQWVRENLFLPLGMRDTGYVLPKFDPDRVAQGYREGERWGTTLERPMDEDGPYWILRANGGIHMAARDMHKWAAALVERKVLSEESFKKLWSPHVDEGNGEMFYGYGWVVIDLPDGTRAVNHDGGNPAHVAVLVMIPETGLILFGQSNVRADFPAPHLMFERIVMAFLTGQELPEAPPAVREVDAEEAARYTGTYRLDTGGTIDVAHRLGSLVLEPHGRDAHAALAPAGDHDPATLDRRSETVQTFMNAMLRGDYQPMFDAYEGRVPLERLQQGGEQRRRDDEERLGRATGAEVLWTAPRGEGLATMVRIDHERGATYRRYLWNPDGTMTGFHPLSGLPAPLTYRWAGDGVFHAIETDGQTIRTLRLAEDEEGNTLLIAAEGAPIAVRGQ